ncbi:NAD(P)/FAD-dependent oxidoreductase [Paenibacillus sp. GCM10027627]|uniref:NAD(P)/FAD-dependent oxidoreductase n=1 Tax=unclassified Paenibacillus TaxID=185978 RepID=UPI003624BF11
MKRIVILGGGYAGLLCALTVRKFVYDVEADILLINRTPTHQLITELHRLAAGNLAEQAVGLSLAKLIQGKRIRLATEEITAIDTEQKQIHTNRSDLAPHPYDYLVLALGSETAYYNIPGLKQHALPLKSIDDANRIHSHIAQALSRYRLSGNQADATIVVGGGGLSGIEMAGELADMVPKWSKQYDIDQRNITLVCIEASPSILAGFPASLAARAKLSLEKRGVQFKVGIPVTAYDYPYIGLQDGTAIAAHTLIWTGGVQGNSLVDRSSIETLGGRAAVNEHLQSISHQNIFAAGDSAIFFDNKGKPLPPTAQLAWQMGEAVGYNLYAALNGLPLQPFVPTHYGKLASLGRKDAVAALGKQDTPLKGIPATLLKEASKAKYLTHIRGLHAYLH